MEDLDRENEFLPSMFRSMVAPCKFAKYWEKSVYSMPFSETNYLLKDLHCAMQNLCNRILRPKWVFPVGSIWNRKVKSANATVGHHIFWEEYHVSINFASILEKQSHGCKEFKEWMCIITKLSKTTEPTIWS